MISLHSLKNDTRPKVKRKRVGRGLGSGLGRTCGRGQKGMGARAGCKRRDGREGGQMPLHMKTPIRGFSHARFRCPYHVVNLWQLQEIFEDGQEVTLKTLRERGVIRGESYGLKILGEGELTKKVRIEAQAISAGAREKLQQQKIAFVVKEGT